MIGALIHVIKERQATIRLSMAQGNVVSFEAYQRLVGEYQGLQWLLDTIDEQLEEKE
jgi:hypothetical protein